MRTPAERQADLQYGRRQTMNRQGARKKEEERAADNDRGVDTTHLLILVAKQTEPQQSIGKVSERSCLRRQKKT